MIGMHDDVALMRTLAAHKAGIRHIVFGHILVPLASPSAEGIAFSSGQACAHRFITDLTRPKPYWTDGNPCYRIINLDAQGLRAYGVEVSEVIMGQAPICDGP